MQYSIPLPPGYDAEQVAERVQARRALFDAHPGLLHKSFLYHAPHRLYAPFYVWRHMEDGRDFLANELFQGVVRTFTRHRVRSWYGVSLAYGNDALQAGYARREIDLIAPEISIQAFIERQRNAQDELARNPNLYMHFVAFDADRWETLQFSLWKDAASAPKSESDTVMEYDVLHISEPEQR